MLEDKVLIWKFKCGSRDALYRIYEKYKKDLLRLAVILSNNASDAEDIVHDVFVSFAQSAETLKLSGNLKSFLLTCVANRARNKNRANQCRQTAGLDEAESVASQLKTPEQWMIQSEELRRWSDIMAQLPYEQRETVILHLRAGMKFRQIAQSQGVSVNTVKGRYRYGLDKLRSILDGEFEK
ncbi:MAG: sigma-70 family RNA polymerase sigma factor [Sedimentisphaerales bacterium]|nr:sigma-70 family RNA polymerase sigma factor [Sedimentisphaerales bacterium]